MMKTASGGLFVTDDLVRDQARVDAGEIVPTGPLPGGREVEPPVDTEAWRLESEALADVAVTREELASAGRSLPGARRPLIIKVTPGDPAVNAEGGVFAARLFLAPWGVRHVASGGAGRRRNVRARVGLAALETCANVSCSRELRAEFGSWFL